MVQRVEASLHFVPPMECKEVGDESAIPTGAEWQYEIKFDGYRQNSKGCATIEHPAKFQHSHLTTKFA
jgi:hypothetical protein